MIPAEKLSAAEFIESIRPDLERIFAKDVRPAFGSAGVTCYFHEDKLARVEVTASVMKLARGQK